MVGRGPAVRVTPLKSRMFCEVCFWTETDLPRGLCDVWCWGINGHGAVRPNLLSLTHGRHYADVDLCPLGTSVGSSGFPKIGRENNDNRIANRSEDRSRHKECED